MKTKNGASRGWLGASGIILGIGACVPSQPAADTPAAQGDQAAPSATAAAPKPAAPPAPPAPPAAPVPPNAKTGNVNVDRFLALWTDIHKLSNGYFSPEGIPYHSVETLIVEAPDYGHETTSEAYSYWLWLEAAYGRVTKDWSFIDRAWSNLEYYIIPRSTEQPTTASYNPAHPATYAEEGDLPSQYPKPLDSSVRTGADPIAAELKATYGTSDIYGMHWLMDVDNWYGFGRMGDGTSHAALINTFQRGPQESVWETVTQPTWENFKWGGPNGFLDIFQKGGSFARQWKYTAAPDADARAVQAVYWAKVWADEQGGNGSVDGLTKKAAKLGDFARYSLFDKYFKKLGCTSPSCADEHRLRLGPLPHLLVLRVGRVGAAGRRLVVADRLEPQPLGLPEPDGGLGARQASARSSPPRRTRRGTGESASRGKWSFTAGSRRPRAASPAAPPIAGRAATRRPPRGPRPSTGWPTTRRPCSSIRRATSGSACRCGRWSAWPSTTTRAET